jgi:hypothetical protein
MTVEPFVPFVVQCLGDKSEDIRGAAAPIVQRFLALPGAADAIRKHVDPFSPAKKNAILAQINPAPPKGQLFISKPTVGQKSHREQKIDPFLSLNVMNKRQDHSVLIQTTTSYASRYFTLPLESSSPADVAATGQQFIAAGETEFESLSLVLDIVFLWWAQQSLLIQDNDGLAAVSSFLLQFIPVLVKKNRVIVPFELTIILPTVLEFVGRRYENCTDIRNLLWHISDQAAFLGVLVSVLAKVASVYAVQASLDTLLELLPNAQWAHLRPDLMKTVTHVHSQLAKDPSQHQETFETAARLLEYLQSTAPSDAAPAKPVRSQCGLNPRITAKMDQPPILVYKWIVNLTSTDKDTLITSLRSISAQLKSDAHILESHLEVLTISLLTLVHVHFGDDDRNDRLCKYVAFCLISLLECTNLRDVISHMCVHQLLYELFTHLSNGLSDPNLHQVANKLLTTLIDECTIFSLGGIVSGFGEYENTEQFTENWIKLTTKCFQACGTRICNVAKEEDVKESLTILEKFFQKHPHATLLDSFIGRKIIRVIRTYLLEVFEKFPELVNSREVKKRLVVIPSILQLVVVNKQ